MDNNPYQAPQAPLEPKKDRTQGSIAKAVILGSLVDIGGTMIFGFVSGIVLAFIALSQGSDLETMIESIDAGGITHPFNLIAALIGLIMSTLGGYITARIACLRSYKAVTIMMCVTMVIGILLSIVDNPFSLMENIILFALSIACIYLGGWLFIKDLEENSENEAIWDYPHGNAR